MRATPRYLVQLSSAEIAFLHALVQRRVRGLVAERPEGRGLDLATAPPELVSLDRRLLARLEEVTRDEEVYYGGRRTRPEAGWIGEEHAALAEVAAQVEGGAPAGAGTSRGTGGGVRRVRATVPAEVVQIAAFKAPTAPPAEQGGNVTLLRAAERPAARVG